MSPIMSYRVSEVSGELFIIDSKSPIKSKPNFSALADHGKPPSVGKKLRKGMSKRGSKNVQDVILNSNEQDFSSRVPSGEG